MDIETLDEALKDFEKKGKKDVCPVLDQFLCHVAKTGETITPFTIQRLCELLTDPRRNYTGTDKFLRGIEKNVMVVSCIQPCTEKTSTNSLSRMNGVMFPGNSPGYTERSNVNGPGTPRPVNRPKSSLSAPMTTNGLPDSTENKESSLQPTEDKEHSEHEKSESEDVQVTPVKNKHPNEEVVEVEGSEAKRFKFDEEDRASTSQATPGEMSSVLVEETKAHAIPQDKDKENMCARPHISEEEEEEEDEEEDEEEEEEEESFITPREATPERKDQEKESDDSLSLNEETAEESSPVEECDLPEAEKDISIEDSESTRPESNGADLNKTEELGTLGNENQEIPSEPEVENSDEVTEIVEESMEHEV
ncbi:serine/threonine-protein phosphatase 4 regulatory subunit 2 isoform X2 [Ornithorhynchus anatinus]|uniref:serine/threonine-protein phosphatase 4 regulatory subunit 2 isoform X2 n=1 Tax=Ornithorhynchus anatinus TaxID=9258 RepID=UPI0010A89672|nr:serine/threonine-protein phosphatase 4 regulatory subunit 2 isoform X2 [Ornithorhynchus anatinus]